MCQKELKINNYNPVFQGIDELLKTKGGGIVAIDGGSAAGKTTLSQILSEQYECNVFHIDDFFVPMTRRIELWKEEPAGNIDKERFLQEVLVPLSRGESISYRKFDCKEQAFSEPLESIFTKLTIVEGAYSTHPSFSQYYDLKIFLDVNTRIQSERIEVRNTPEKQKMFHDTWIPLEKRYFETFSIKENCDLIVVIDEQFL